jgi:hypothetical protein
MAAFILRQAAFTALDHRKLIREAQEPARRFRAKTQWLL